MEYSHRITQVIAKLARVNNFPNNIYNFGAEVKRKERWSGEICICCSENSVDFIVS